MLAISCSSDDSSLQSGASETDVAADSADDAATEVAGEEDSAAEQDQNGNDGDGGSAERADRLPSTPGPQSTDQLMELFRSASQSDSVSDAITGVGYLIPQGTYGTDAGTLVSLRVGLSNGTQATVDAEFTYDGVSRAEILDALRTTTFVGAENLNVPIDQDGPDVSYYILTAADTQLAVAAGNEPDAIQFEVDDSTVAVYFKTTLNDNELAAFKDYYAGWMDEAIPVTDSTLQTVSIGFDEFNPDIRFWVEHVREGSLDEASFTAQADELRDAVAASRFDVVGENTAQGVPDDPRIVLYEFELADTDATFNDAQFTVQQTYDDGPLSGWFLGYRSL